MNKEVLHRNDGNEGDELSLAGLIHKLKEAYFYLLSKWMIILAFGLLGGVAGFAFAYFKKPVFHATSTFVLEDSNEGGGLGQYSALASMAGVDLGGGGGLFKGDNILELYRSRTMIKKALLKTVAYKNTQTQLIDLFIDFNELNKDWQDNPDLKSLSFKDSSKFTVMHDSIFNVVVKKINSSMLVVGKADKSPGIYQVQVNAENQIFAKAFADEIVRTVNNFYVETKTKKSKENLSNLQHQTDSVRAVMNRTMYSSASILDATPNLNPVRQRLRVPLESARMNAETNKIILGELVKNLELAKITLGREVPLIQLIDAPVLPLERSVTGTIKGTVVGAILFSFLISCALLAKRFLLN